MEWPEEEAEFQRLDEHMQKESEIKSRSLEDFNFLIVCSFRYCLGRMTYAPGYFKDILFQNIGKISENTRNIILREIEESKSLGMDCDKQTWMEIKNFLEKRK